jgi:hypothetical protein
MKALIIIIAALIVLAVIPPLGMGGIAILILMKLGDINDSLNRR